MTARCSPRAIRCTSVPPRSSAAPTYAPIAPAPRTATFIRPSSFVHQPGQVAALDLARRPLRDFGQDGDPGRPFERGETVHAVGNELPGGDLGAPEHDDDAYLLAVRFVRHRVGRCLGDCGMAEQHVLHFVRRDLLPGPVDQLLQPAYQRQVAIRAELPTSPVRNQPPEKAAPVAAGLSRYSRRRTVLARPPHPVPGRTGRQLSSRTAISVPVARPTVPGRRSPGGSGLDAI